MWIKSSAVEKDTSMKAHNRPKILEPPASWERLRCGVLSLVGKLEWVANSLA